LTAGRFLDAYQRAFEALDAPAIADLFLYPSHVTSDAGEVEVRAIPSREEWLPQVERLVGAYRAVGVRSAEARAVDSVTLTPLLTQVRVRWGLVDEVGDTIYEFDAAYTLAGIAGDFRIAALAHNELPRLRAAVEQRG
jgi:hypothetical protein